MKLMRWTISILAGLSAVAVAVPYAAGGAWPWVAAAALLGIGWMVVPPHSYRWTASLGLITLTLLAAVAVLRYDAIEYALPGVLSALAAWDLCALTQRLTATDMVRDRVVYMRAHLLQLISVLMAAWILGLLALQITVPIGFLWALGLVLLLVVGLSVVMRTARRTERAP